MTTIPEVRTLRASLMMFIIQIKFIHYSFYLSLWCLKRQPYVTLHHLEWGLSKLNGAMKCKIYTRFWKLSKEKNLLSVSCMLQMIVFWVFWIKMFSSFELFNVALDNFKFHSSCFISLAQLPSWRPDWFNVPLFPSLIAELFWGWSLFLASITDCVPKCKLHETRAFLLTVSQP